MGENPIFSAYQFRDYNMLLCILSKNLVHNRLFVIATLDVNRSKFPHKLSIFDDPPWENIFKDQFIQKKNWVKKYLKVGHHYGLQQ